jgi:alpha-tubulin suppressor-like RCC1 family protein
MTSFVAAAGMWVNVGCDSLSGGKPLALPSGYVFPGAQALVANDDGTSNLTWPLAPLKEAEYRVFKRADGQAMDWNKPIASVKGTLFRTDDLRLQPVTCFAVRFVAPDIEADANTKEICTPKSNYKFAGISSLTREDEGAWILGWEPAPFKGSSYRIHAADPTGGIEAKPVREVVENKARLGPYPLGVTKCFVVRLVLAGRDSDDGNTTVKCTDANKMGAFTGIEGAESSGTGTATLKWTPSLNEDVAGYLVYRGTKFDDVVTRVSPRQLGQVTLKDLTPGEKLTFGVRAVSAAGLEDVNTRTVTLEVKDLRPPRFGGASQASVSGKGEILLRWGLAPEVRAYRIYVWSGETGGQPFFAFDKPLQEVDPVVGDATMQELRVRNLGDEMTHAFVVRAVSRFGVEDRNETIVRADIPDQGPPGFAGVKAAANVAGKVQLTWDPPRGLTKRFRVYRAQGGPSAIDFTSTSIPPELGSSTTALLSGFQANKAYSFVVRAEDAAGNIDSNTHAITLVAGQQSLPNFAGFESVLPKREGEIEVKWFASAGGNVDRYQVAWRKVGQSAFLNQATVLHSAATPRFTYLISGLESRQRYEVRVRAVDPFSNESTNDEILVVTTTDETPPEGFFGASAAEQPAGASTVTVSWPERATTDIAQYRVYWAEVSFANFASGAINHKRPLPTYLSPHDSTTKPISMSPVVDGGAVTFEVANLIKGRTYHFLVRAIDESGNEESNLTNVSAAILNSFPSISANLPVVRIPEREAAEQIELTATDVNAGDVLTIERLSTSCPLGFNAPELTVQTQFGKTRKAFINWTPSQGYIESGREERTCTVTYRVGDGESFSPVVVVTFTAFNRAPRNVLVTIAPQVGGFRRSRDLVCAIAADDDDGNTLTYQYQWIKNGSPLASATTAALTPTAGAFAPGDVFVCRASAYDDHARVEAESAAANFSNEPPAINSVSSFEDGGVSPLHVGDRLACTWNVSDPDNDPVTLESVVVEGSNDGTTAWTPLALDTVECSIQQATRRCFLVGTVARRKHLRCTVSSVSDGYATTPGRSSATAAQVMNSSPRVLSAAIAPAGEIVRGNTLSCATEVTDADGDALVSAPSFQWSRDNVAIPGATSQTYVVELQDRGKGLRCQASLPFNADGFGSSATSPVTSPARTYTNSPPTVSQVAVTPATAPLTGATLTCLPTVVDPDDDPVTVGAPYAAYTWYANAGAGDQVIAGQTNPTLTVTQDLRGKNVRCAFGLAPGADGRGSPAVAPVSSSNMVTPANSSPVITEVNVTASASPAITGTVLTCNRTISDLDGDTLTDTPRYVWRAGGATIGGVTGQTYVLKRADRTKAVACGVFLNANSDGRGAAAVPEVVSTNAITSINSQPNVQNALVTSLFTPPFYPGSVLTCSNYTITDADTDPVLAQFRWYLNDIEIPAQTASEYTLRSSDRGGLVRCGVHLPENADGAGSTELSVKSANAALVQNRPPVNTFTPTIEEVDGGSVFKGSQLRCRIPSGITNFDPDGDAVTFRYVWKKNGSLFTGTDANGTAANTLATEVDDSVNPGTRFTCVVRLDDGDTVALTGDSSALVVLNRAPTTTGALVSISPASIFAPAPGQTLTCNAPEFSDPDGESLVVRYNWSILLAGTGQLWSQLVSNRVSNTLQRGTTGAPLWSKGDTIACHVSVSDATTTLSSPATPTSPASPLGLTLVTASVLNSAPTGSFQCNGANENIVGYANASFGPTGNCTTSNTISDPDNDSISYQFSTVPGDTTCPGVGSTILVNPIDGRISGIMPASGCKVTIVAQDPEGEPVRQTAGGTLSKAEIQLTLPFTALFGEPSLDSSCTLSVPTSFSAGLVGWGSSSFSFSPLVGAPQTHVDAHTTSGFMSGMLNPAGGGGSVAANWEITSGSYVSTISKAFSISDSPASPDVPLQAQAMPGLQPPPRYDGSGTRALSCGLADCTGRFGSIASGYSHNCAVTPSGSLWCWGNNGSGELGRGTTSTPSPSLPQEVPLGADGVKAVAAGGSVLLDVAHTCAILEDRSTTPATNKGVKCWGNNSSGQIGNGSIRASAPYSVNSPTQVTGLTGGTGVNAVRAIVAGGSHSCALMDFASPENGGAVKCWGDNSRGQLGTGTTQTEPAPQSTMTFESSGALGIAAGLRHTCAITNVGSVKCWGDNEHLQLGVANAVGQDKWRVTPVEVPGLTGVVSLATGDRHTCALKSDGVVKCWGNASEGRLGEGSLGGTYETPRPLAGSVLGTLKATAISAGSAHTCAIVEGGGMRCWGNNQQGQVGDNTFGNNRALPVSVEDLSSQALAVEAGYAHTCVLKNNGGVSCFGFYTAVGLEIGQRKPVNNTMPVSISGIPGAVFQNCRALRILKD